MRRRALERLGCRVTTFNLLGPGGLLNRIRGISLQDRLAGVIAQTRPAVVLVLEGIQLTAAAIASLRPEAHAGWFNWFCDGRRTVDTIDAIAPSYDAVFVAGSETAARLTRNGGPPAGYLPAGCDPSIHRPLRSRDQFRANVVFAGTATSYRERMLSGLVEFGLALWGPGWRRTKLRDYCRGEQLEHGDYVRAYAGASVAVNVSYDEEGDVEPGCSRRLFELAAIGVPQVAEHRADLSRHFREGSEILVWRDAAELRALTAEALHDRAWAEQVAAGARQRAIGEHTYVHRMAALLNAVMPQSSVPQPAVARL